MKYVLKFLKISTPIYGQYLRAGYNGSSTVFVDSILHFLFLVNCLNTYSHLILIEVYTELTTVIQGAMKILEVNLPILLLSGNSSIYSFCVF